MNSSFPPQSAKQGSTLSPGNVIPGLPHQEPRTKNRITSTLPTPLLSHHRNLEPRPRPPTINPKPTQSNSAHVNRTHHRSLLARPANRPATHEHWLVENAPLVGLRAALRDFDADQDADEILVIGIRSGLVRISQEGTELSVQFHAGPAKVHAVVQSIRDFLQQQDLLPLDDIRICNSHNENERTLPVSQFEYIVDFGGQIFPRPSVTTKRLAGLVICHVALGCALAFWTRPHSSSALWLSWPLILCEISMLAVWVSLANTFQWRRLIGAVAGLFYLWVLMDAAAGVHDIDVLILVCGLFFVTLFVMVSLRFTKLRLRQLDLDVPLPATVAFQFSIRQMMALTAVIAILFAIARSGLGWFLVLDTTFLALPTLLATWAALGLGLLRLRIPFALVACIAVGLISGFIHQAWMPYRFWLTVTLTQGIFSLASLLVVRTCGYRLLRTPPPTA
jgi:hypothetical protein